MPARAIIVLLAAALLLGRSFLPYDPPFDQARLALVVQDVPLDADRAELRRVGALLWLGGWSLDAASEDFGGLSALRVTAGHALAVSDAGGLVSFALPPRDGAAVRLVPVPGRCGNQRVHLGRDLEGLALHDGRLWVSSERHNAICRRDMAGRWSGVQPRAIAGWARFSGAETLLRLRDGRFLMIREGRQFGQAPRAVLLFDRDPLAQGALAHRLTYRPARNWAPVDATQLPDGRIVVLHRSLGLLGFASRIALFDALPSPTRPSVTSRTLAVLAAPLVHDNFEGIEATSENGRTILWLLSDDNFSQLQQTLLLKFALRG